MIELAIAAALMSVGVIALMGSLAFGMSMVGGARQRSTGATVATERLERVHNLPYERVALYEQPTHNSDPNHPDHKVTEDDTSYRVDDSTTEPLIVDLQDGALKHLDDPFTLGQTEFTVHQYVTWVDDAGIIGSTQDYKRVTVVVTWKFPVESSTRNTVTLSTFVSDATVSLPATQSEPESSPGPDGGPEAPPADPEACPEDETGPTGEVEALSGAGAEQGYTATTVVQIRLKASDPCGDIWAQLSNDGLEFSGVATLTSDLSEIVSWTIPGGEGTKTVWAKFRDGAGNYSTESYTTNVVLDQTPPTVPGNFRVVSCTISGNDRTVSLAWDSSTDTNLLGYRVYGSIDSAAFEAIQTTSTLSTSDTHRKSHGSVRYKVRAYDKAGTESGDSDVLSFSKNVC